MAASAVVVGRGSLGDMWVRLVDVTLDGSYPTGGYALTPQQLGVGQSGTILGVFGDMSKTGGWDIGWDYTNSKLQVFDGSGSASAAAHEVAAATSLSTVTARLMVLAKGSPG